MKIKSITKIGKHQVYDISVKDVEHYLLDNGVASHNTGSYYSADNIFILGRQQEKEGTEIVGYNFIINVEKSRYTKEKAKIPVCVSFEGGISKYSGMIDLALEGKFIIKPSNGWYSKVDVETGEISDKKYRLKDTENEAFWGDILSSDKFNDFIKSKYQVSHGSIIKSEISDEEIVEVFDSIDED